MQHENVAIWKKWYMKKLQSKKVQGGKIATRKNCNMEILYLTWAKCNMKIMQSQHEKSATWKKYHLPEWNMEKMHKNIVL